VIEFSQSLPERHDDANLVLMDQSFRRLVYPGFRQRSPACAGNFFYPRASACILLHPR
jgi:hypothetical protein